MPYVLHCQLFSRTPSYQAPIRLIITRSGEISFSGGTTQLGDPLGMAKYAIGMVPHIHKFRIYEHRQTMKQVWFANDAMAAGTCEYLCQW